MEKFEKILVIDNEFEAERLTEILNGKNIPHGIVRSSDSVLGGIEQLEFGWGYLEAPLNYLEEIMAIYQEIGNK
jgi:hypothetical protein